MKQSHGFYIDLCVSVAALSQGTLFLLTSNKGLTQVTIATVSSGIQ